MGFIHYYSVQLALFVDDTQLCAEVMRGAELGRHCILALSFPRIRMFEAQ
jgi:hypothetical protein